MNSNWKIYTKKGDTGETSLIGGRRVLKSDPRIEAYGTVDELNCFAGWLRDSITNEHHRKSLLQIQNTLFLVESYLAWEPGTKADHIPPFDTNEITFLEQEIDNMEKDLPVLTSFIIPGGHVHNSLGHVCRTVARRAERMIIALAKEQEVPEFTIKYMNRLSDYFFVLARHLSMLNGAEEIQWIPGKKS